MAINRRRRTTMFNLVPWKKRESNGGESLVRPTDYPLSRMRDEFDALFDRFFGRWPVPFAGEWDVPRPWGLDMDDTGKEVTVRAEAPGFEAGEFDVAVSGNVLTIKAEHKQEAGDKKNGYRSSERRLHQSVTLPPGTDPDKVEARYRNGVLEVRLPKTAEAQGRRITVKS
jgi:HSP20 family protein